MFLKSIVSLRVLAVALAAVLYTGAPSAAVAQQEALRLSCKFDAGHSWTYEAGKFASSAPSPLAFDVDGIDLEGQSAKLIVEGKPSGTLRIVRALNANHFLEVANEGFLNLTTIYDRDPATGSHPAVHSRHFGLFGQPMFAQYTGACTPQ